MKDLYIVGAGGYGREVLGLVLEIHKFTDQRWNIKGFLDDTEDPLKGKACDFGVVGTIMDYQPKNNDVLAMGVSDPKGKEKLASLLLGRGARFEKIIHPFIQLGTHCVMGEGTILPAGFGMTANVTLGNFTTMLACCLGHDVVVGDYSTISTHCNIMGGVNIGKRVYIGGNVAVAPGVSIGDDAFLCLGSAVLKNVKTGSKVMGNPAREIG